MQISIRVNVAYAYNVRVGHGIMFSAVNRCATFLNILEIKKRRSKNGGFHHRENLNSIT